LREGGAMADAYETVSRHIAYEIKLRNIIREDDER
jgi:hypothetical protein